MKAFKIFVSRCIDLGLSLILLVIAVFLILHFIFGITPYITMSGSMEPAIHTGSLCFVNTRAEYSDIEEGDIIAFTNTAGVKVTHRVIAVTEDGFETKGDANEVSDGLSTKEWNFCGKTLFSIPYLGYVVKFVQIPRNLICSVLIAGGLFVLSGFLSHDGKEPES